MRYSYVLTPIFHWLIWRVFNNQEMLSRSAAETRQLELLSDISGLKLRFAAMEKDNMELRGQLKRSEQDMITLVSQVKKNRFPAVTPAIHLGLISTFCTVLRAVRSHVGSWF